jgi:hypothetical protein
MGFVLNPYDACVANKMINERLVVDNIIALIEEQYGKMVVTHGNQRTYVGMDIEFTNDGEAKIFMTKYLKEAIDAFPEDCNTLAKAPAASHLFEVNDECARINEADIKKLHSIVAKLLFVAKRARPDT